MTNQTTLDKTAELSNQELSLEQLDDISAEIGPVGGAIIIGGLGYGAYKLGK